jgi:hypothetical protein
MILKKYNFKDKEQAEEKITTLYNEEKELKYNCDIFKLGKLIDVKGEYDIDGNVIKEPIYLDGYSVDILFRDLKESPYGFKTYEVEPKNPKHKII